MKPSTLKRVSGDLLQQSGESLPTATGDERWENTQHSTLNLEHPLADEGDEGEAADLTLEDIERRVYRECSELMFGRLKGICASIQGFNGNRQFAFECALLALGFNQIVGVRDMTALAERWKCTKENVRKLVDQIQRDNDLPKTTWQREEAGCKEMSVARRRNRDQPKVITE